MRRLEQLDGEAREQVGRAVAESADPARAMALLEQLADVAPEASATALASDAGRTALIALATASRSLIRWLAAHPTELRYLADPRLLAPPRDKESLLVEILASVATAPVPEDALRLWKQRNFLRIALRDVLGLTTFREVGEGLSDLADACLHAALVIATEGRPDSLAIIGMGKLGGRELNYSSDVDVLLVSPDNSDHAAPRKLARRFLDVMSRHSREGIVWRVDTNLRPEGRSGPLTRSLASYVAYYERWAEAWEFQALIKRRAAAGDPKLGMQFVAETEHSVFPPEFPPERLEEIRTLKARAEAHIAEAGLTEREVKLGRGGIRDVEFAVQILQLVHGRHDPTIRSPNTLTALHQLADSGYIAPEDGDVLANSYIKLRTVEHALQLEEEAQVHALPVHSEKLDHLARVLGYKPDETGSATEHFLEEFRADVATVRGVHERLFYRPLLEAFAGPTARDGISPLAAQERLQAFGFSNVAATRRALQSLTSGLSRRSRLMEAMLPLILGWLSDAADPNLGLLMLDRLTSDRHRADSLTAAFRDSPLVAQRLCTLIGTSRLVGEGLEHFPELVRMLEDDDALAIPRPRAEIADVAARHLSWRDDRTARLRAIRLFVQRERVRIATRDLLGFADAGETADQLTAVAEASLEGALHSAAAGVEDPPTLSIVGMGSFGSGALTYGSDLDILVVYDHAPHVDGHELRRNVQRIIADLIETLSALTHDGRAFDLDLDLRPEGKHGPVARSIRSYVAYWQRWAETWEFQALTHARHVAGDAALSEKFLEAAARFVYESPFSERRLTDIRKMKARVESERLPRGADPQFHLKLGRGGFTDIEFAVELLQMRHGGIDPAVRCPSTLDALSALTTGGYLDPANAERLHDAYRLIGALRNRLVLLGARDPNELPKSYAELGKLARSLGYEEHPAPALREEYRRVTRRARQVVDAILYPSADRR